MRRTILTLFIVLGLTVGSSCTKKGAGDWSGLFDAGKALGDAEMAIDDCIEAGDTSICQSAQTNIRSARVVVMGNACKMNGDQSHDVCKQWKALEKESETSKSEVPNKVEPAPEKPSVKPPDKAFDTPDGAVSKPVPSTEPNATGQPTSWLDATRSRASALAMGVS